MADEAVLKNRDSDIRYVTIADGTAITKGALMTLSADPDTAISHTPPDSGIPIGVAVEDKVASDGQTRIGIRVRGDVQMTANGTIGLGGLVIPSLVANRVKVMNSGSNSLTDLKFVLGRSLEDVTDGQTIKVRLMLG